VIDIVECGHSGEEAGYSPVQLAQKMRMPGTERWGERLHDTQPAGFLQCFHVWLGCIF